MLWFLNLITVLVTSFPIYRSIKRVLQGQYGILHILVVVFGFMQIFPLAVENIFGVHDSLKVYPPMYNAMTDFNVGAIYCLFVTFTVYYLYWAAKHPSKKCINMREMRTSILNKAPNKMVSFILLLGMFAPCFAVMFSPKPEVYFEFSYFYMNEYMATDSHRIYHLGIVLWANYIALGCTMLQYLFRKSGRLIDNIDILLAIIVFTWVDGKRALLTFALLGLLAIDIIRKRYSYAPRKYVFRAIAFAAVVLLYFVFYGSITGKNNATDFLVDYVMYYSRHSCVKVAIYDRLYSKSMLSFDGQSILYNLFFFIPRTFWPDKPVLFCKYFTSFAVGYSYGFLNWNMHVNLWTEFIANFGLMGVVIALLFIQFVVRKSEKSKSVLVYLFGTGYLVFYFMFGFETLTQLVYIAWIGTLLWTEINRLLKVKLRIS